MQKSTRQNITNGINKYTFVIGALVTTTTINSGIIDNSKLTAVESTLETGYIYLGTYTFVIKDALPTIDINPFPTESVKKVNKTEPHNKYKGKFSIPCRKIVENIIY